MKWQVLVNEATLERRRTRALNNAWRDRKILEKLEECHRNSDLYTTISEQLKKQGFLQRHWNQCRTK